MLAVARASTADAAKPRQVLAAWGPAPHGNSWQEINMRRSRSEAERWAGSPAGKEAGVVRTVVNRTAWWEELAKYRFMLSPDGSAITRPATLEALLLFTIPIVERTTPYHDAVLSMGWPMVVVDDWSDITPGKLQTWWQELSPRLEQFRRKCLTSDVYFEYFKSGKFCAT
eukprot:TRINITY_DN107806_c0_g1_i1.p1 TRINITY_DN107806_c0_g1~~TRINITY_DN107806_c0_g1_i1.p1  ORF type:complete len:196 (-),score=34.21 TRINITY_DN107806_c0_g1_i1:219-728(-)